MVLATIDGIRISEDYPEGHPYREVPNLTLNLNFAGGVAKIREFVEALPEDRLIDLAGQHDVLAEDENGETLVAPTRDATIKYLTDRLREVFSSIGEDDNGDGSGMRGWRDVGSQTRRVHGQDNKLLFEFETGGMSWGDSPTEAFDVWEYFRDGTGLWDEFTIGETHYDVLKAAGFIGYDDVETVVILK
jgi:hypothetical protein